MGENGDAPKPRKDAREPKLVLSAIEIVEAADIPWEAAEAIITAISLDYATILGPLDKFASKPVGSESSRGRLVMREVRAALKGIRSAKGKGLKIQQAALRDGLTGLFRPEWLDTRLTKLFETTEDPYVGIVMIDLRHFKVVNDTFEHDTGSALLGAVGRLIQSQIRSKLDFAVRYGGDEFVLVLRHLPHRNELPSRDGLEKELVGVCTRIKKAMLEADWSVETRKPVFKGWSQGADMGALIVELGPRGGRVGNGAQFVKDAAAHVSRLMLDEKRRAKEAGQPFSYAAADVQFYRDRLRTKDEVEVLEATGPPKAEPLLQMGLRRP